MIVYYTWVLLISRGIGALLPGQSFGYSSRSFRIILWLGILPIFGRVLGWW